MSAAGPPAGASHSEGVPFDAVVLAGGRASRLGGASKPDVVVRGRRMLAHVLDAAQQARQAVVVGPPALDVPAGVRLTLEDPPDGGPAAGIAAGLAALEAPGEWVLLLACDVPLVAAAVPRLRDVAAARRDDAEFDGVMLVDADGREQPLVGLYRRAGLLAGLARLGAERGVRGASVRAVLAGLQVERLADEGASADVDTWEDVRRVDG